MKKVSLVLTLAAVLAVAVSLGASSAQATSSEQVVFSGVGFSPSANQPVGFWIWCEADSGNPYQGECSGAMYFYALHITKHVEDVAPIEEPAEGQYLMTVESSDGSVACTLENEPPATSGPTNTVNVACTAPAAFTDGVSTNAVVNVTGPG